MKVHHLENNMNKKGNEQPNIFFRRCKMTVTLVEDLCYLVHSEQVDVPADIKWSATASILDSLFMSARKNQTFRFTCKFQDMQSKIWSMPMLPGSLRKILQC